MSETGSVAVDVSTLTTAFEPDLDNLTPGSRTKLALDVEGADSYFHDALVLRIHYHPSTPTPYPAPFHQKGPYYRIVFLHWTTRHGGGKCRDRSWVGSIPLLISVWHCSHLDVTVRIRILEILVYIVNKVVLRVRRCLPAQLINTYPSSPETLKFRRK